MKENAARCGAGHIVGALAKVGLWINALGAAHILKRSCRNQWKHQAGRRMSLPPGAAMLPAQGVPPAAPRVRELVQG